MKAIYDAVRDLLYPEHLQKRAGPALTLPDYPWEVRFVLRDFERRNRGHRNQLANPELAARALNLIGTPEHARREVLSETSHALFTFLLQGPLRRLPNSPAVSAVLRAQDDSGWLRQHVSQLLDYHFQEALRRLSSADCDARHCRLEDADDHFVLHLAARASGRDTQASRKFVLSAAPCTSLAEAHTFVRNTLTCIQDILYAIPLWPEFSDAPAE